jgi:hypothetical protein
MVEVRSRVSVKEPLYTKSEMRGYRDAVKKDLVQGVITDHLLSMVKTTEEYPKDNTRHLDYSIDIVLLTRNEYKQLINKNE